MKTKEELNALKEEAETESRKFHELTEEDLEQVLGGAYNNGLTDQYTGDTYTDPGYPDDYYLGSH